MWCIHTIEHYTVLKRKGTLIQATAWMNLENIVAVHRPDTKGQIPCHSTPVRSLEESNPETQRAGWWGPGLGEE